MSHKKSFFQWLRAFKLPSAKKLIKQVSMSAAMRDASAQKGVPVQELQASHRDPSDFEGYPHKSE